MPLFIGLPMWALPAWQYRFFSQEASSQDYLKQYASVFNCVEGNTSFYAIPSAEQVQAWQAAVPRGFQFCFKLPRAISHDLRFTRCDELLAAFLERIKPLSPALGPLMIQLPPSFDGSQLDKLRQFIGKLPARHAYALEPRHNDFFNHSASHHALDELLAEFYVDRVVFDSQALFACSSADAAVLEAQQKKPHFAVPEITLQRCLFLRFIGQPDWQQSLYYFQRWLEPIAQALKAGKRVYLMVHMPDNADAPLLAKQLYQMLQTAVQGLADLPLWPIERENGSGQLRLF